VVTAPALADVGGVSRLYAVSSAGRVCRLDPDTGKVVWTFDVKDETQQEATLFSSPAVGVEGGHCRLYFGSGLNSFSRGILYCVEDR
jgi:outer membrane protein assembly factor BamB